MTGKDADNLRSGRVALALAVLVTGAAGGFALRTATGGPAAISASDAKTSAISHRSLPLSADSAAARERPLRSRSHARPQESVTLSAEQWAKVVAEPDRYALSIEKLRHPAEFALAPRIRAHAELLGWNESISDQVSSTLTDFNRKLMALEKDQSEVTYAALEPAGGGVKLVVTYDRMAEVTEGLLSDLQDELRHILGAKDAARFTSAANLSEIQLRRTAAIRDELVVYAGSDEITVMQEISGPVDEISTRTVRQGQIHQRGPTFTSAAVDWDRVLRAARGGPDSPVE